MNMKQKRAAALKVAQDIINGAKAMNRDLTADEVTAVEAKHAEIADLDAQIKEATKQEALVKKIGYVPHNWDDLTDGAKGHLSFRGVPAQLVKDLGDHAQRAGGPLSKGIAPSGETLTPVSVVAPTDGPAPSRLVEALGIVRRDTPTYRILRQATIASAGGAGTVPVGGLKPTKKLGLEPHDQRLKVVAVLSEPQDRYLLEDMGNLTQWVSVELIDAVMTELENQILNGDGTGENFTGLANTSGVQTVAYATDRITTIAHGIGALQTLGRTPGLIVLHPTDWLAVQTARNTGGGFDLGGPIDATARTAWGVPVTTSPAATVGEGYVLATNAVNLSTDGRGLRTEWASPGDQFNRNQLTARVEGRFELDVFTPTGIAKLELTSE